MRLHALDKACLSSTSSLPKENTNCDSYEQTVTSAAHCASFDTEEGDSFGGILRRTQAGAVAAEET